MRARERFLVGVVLALAAVRLCAGPDDEYLALFNRLQAAEESARAGAVEAAREGFQEARRGLLNFQRQYPAWNPEVIGFRLRYVDDRLAALAVSGPTDSAPGKAGPAAPPAEAAAGVPSPLQVMEARIRELEFERDRLAARLREALAARPAPGTSPELLEAENQIREQRREIDLLRFAVAELREGRSADATAAPEESHRAEVERLQAELEAERAKVATLQSMAAQLQERLRTLEPAAAPGAPATGRAAARSAAPAAAGSEASTALKRGRALLESGHVDEALVWLGQACQAAPDAVEPLVLLGRAMSAKGLQEPAESVLQRAIALDSRCAPAHLEMARLCLRRSPPDLNLARSHYQQALKEGEKADPAVEAALRGGSR